MDAVPLQAPGQNTGARDDHPLRRRAAARQPAVNAWVSGSLPPVGFRGAKADSYCFAVAWLQGPACTVLAVQILIRLRHVRDLEGHRIPEQLRADEFLLEGRSAGRRCPTARPGPADRRDRENSNRRVCRPCRPRSIPSDGRANVPASAAACRIPSAGIRGSSGLRRSSLSRRHTVRHWCPTRGPPPTPAGRGGFMPPSYQCRVTGARSPRAGNSYVMREATG